MSLILTLTIIGLMAAVFLIITKPGHDRREKEFHDYVDNYLNDMEKANQPFEDALLAALTEEEEDGEEDVPADRD
jgi:hypothetical protein